ncbi:MAG: site-specific DNA-methyltransferase [Candidatus Nanopusillus acidilobi]
MFEGIYENYGETKMKEKVFEKSLQNLFVGNEIEGKGGFVKLFRAKEVYYQKLVDEIQKEVEKYGEFKEEIYGILNEFLSLFDNKLGTIYLKNIDGKNSLWDMQKWLYYVKTDVVFQSMSVESNGITFFFDASSVEYKKNNERRNITYRAITSHFDAKEHAQPLDSLEKCYKSATPQHTRLKEVKDNTVTFLVYYEEGDAVTNIDEIAKIIGNRITEADLKKVFKKYERKVKQTERDFFIHKDIRSFLKEQLKLWLGEYVYNKELTQNDGEKLQITKEIAYKLIDLIGAFEDEVLKLWYMPKAVKNANYVITLDRIAMHGSNGPQVIDKLVNHQGMQEQIKEWKALGVVDDGFKAQDIKEAFDKYKYLPIDTKYFKDLELEILGLFDDIDNALDGWLIKSENWQALNTLLPKFKEKVQTIYIDPPYNTGNDGFLYRDGYQHSSWLTMMENRLSLAKELMSDDGVIFVSIDDNEVNELNILLKTIPLIKVSTIKIFSNPRGRQSSLNIAESSEYLLVYSKKNQKVIRGESISEEKRREYKYKDNIGFYRLLELRHRGSGSDYYYVKSLDYPIFYNPQTGDIKLEYDPNYIEIHPVGKTGKGRWTWSKEKLKEDKHLLVVKQTKNGKWRVFRKDYLHESELSKPLDMWIEKEINYDRSSEEIRNLFKDKIFTFAKPIYLICKTLNISTNKDSFILDFFAGSGTTAHAVMKLNKEDGGKRKFILVEIGDHFDTVIIPRVKKVAYSFNWRDGKPQDADGVGGFFVYFELEQFEDVLDRLVSMK